ncbi:MAG: DUF5110 domain-containing protein [Clostridia bacterium]|nr:DUF5110 domain-containing protein [Clostridia bacterium]
MQNGLISERKPMSCEMNPDGGAVFTLPLFLGTLRLRVLPLACGAVRITRTLREAFLPSGGPAVIPQATGVCTVKEEADSFLADCGSMRLRVCRKTGAVTFLTSEGEILLREDPKHPCTLEEKTVRINRFSDDGSVSYTQGIDGVRASSESFETVEDRTACAYKWRFAFDPEEGLYGLGSHEEGFGNLRGKSRVLYQHNLKAVVPVLLSTRGWGLLPDAGCLMSFHDDEEGSYLWADCADEMDAYIMGAGMETVYRQYAELTGHAPMLPRYALGYVQSKERYVDAAELIAVAEEYRRREIPLDVIVQDWQSWPDGQWGWKVFDETRFPDPRKLTETLHGMGAKLMLSIWPSMQGEKNENRKEMLEQGCMLGNRTIYNAFDEKARDLYWKQVNEGLFRYGVDAWWCDCSEPFESDWHGRIRPEPFERAELNTAEAKKYLDPGKISLYSLYHSQGIYEGQRGTDSSKRVLNLTRSSWAGQHRYATITWSGDVSSTWEVLRRQIPEGLNFMATGEGWWTTDAGGFFPMDFGGAWFGSGDFNGGVDDPGYRELFVRWMQFAAFLPMMRAHGTGTPREIWRFGEPGSPWYDALAKIIRLRSMLVPHLYSLAAAYSDKGLPMVRIPALVFAQDPQARRRDDEMMVGDSVLVRPVTHPMEYLPEGRKAENTDDLTDVYLPAGTDWFAWETGKRFHGGQTLRVHAPLDTVPVYVRAGGIVLTGPVRQYTEEQPDAPLTVTVYPGADGSFIWYEDAGDGYGYEQGECARVLLRWNDAARGLTVSERKGRFPGMAEKRKLVVKIPEEGEHVLMYDGNECSVSF